MKKVLLVTMYGVSNFGNRLQSFALSKTLEGLNFDVETFKPIKKKDVFSDIKLILKFFLKKDYSFFRKKMFTEFNNSFIVFKNIDISIDKISVLNNHFDYFIVGSDQVWNYHYLDECSYDGGYNYFLLEDVDNCKRISYSSSFGVSEIKSNLDKYKEEFLKFKCLSTREESGRKIIENLTSRNDITVNVDPTMLLTNKEWEKVIKKPKFKIPDNYILLYFLGDISNDKMSEIVEFANKFNYSIINLLDKKSKFYGIGPSEFLYLEKNAKLILTDSFHSSVFSLIFNVPFIIYNRMNDAEKTNTRLENFVNKFKLYDRIYINDNSISDYLVFNYSEAYKILNYERKKSFSYLKCALDIKGCENNEE